MNRESIKSSVKQEVENWKKGPEGNYSHISLSPKALDFITDMINTISEEPPPNWNQHLIAIDDYEPYQRKAIRSIPAALSYLIKNRPFNLATSTISIWEIWQSLSNILTEFCFIPENDM